MFLKEGWMKRRDIRKGRCRVLRFSSMDLRKFLTQWVISLENETIRTEQTSGYKSTNSKNNFKGNKSRGRKELSVYTTNITKDVRCSICKEGHALIKCKKFQELPSWRRGEQVRKVRACFRCLGPNHSIASYSLTIRCRYCQGEHNSLLHLGEIAPSQGHSNEPVSTSAASKSLETAQVTNMMTMTTGTVLLATAKLKQKSHFRFAHC